MWFVVPEDVRELYERTFWAWPITSIILNMALAFGALCDRGGRRHVRAVPAGRAGDRRLLLRGDNRRRPGDALHGVGSRDLSGYSHVLAHGALASARGFKLLTEDS
jgi:hypothetical protein